MKIVSSSRRRSYLLLLALLLPLLAACGGTPNSGTTAATATTGAAEPTTAAATEPTATTETATDSAPAESLAEPTATTAPAAEPTTDTVAGDAAGDKVMRVHVVTYPDVVDPQKSSFATEISVLSQNYEGLTRLDKNLQAVPAAAESWEFSPNADVVTFTLRSGLKYSDGSPLTAENFRYAVERTCNPETAGEYQSILFEIVGCADWASAPLTDTAALEAGKQLLDTGVQAPDEHTLVLKLTRPAPYYVYIAGLWVMYPAKQELVEQGGEDWWKDPALQVGNGPYKLVQMEEDQLIALEANENYWEGQPKLSRFEYIFQKDTAVALEAYRAGQLDILVPDPSQIPALKEDPELSKELLIYPGANSVAWGFNLTKEPFNDKKVREAIAWAMDRQTYCDVIRNGDCVPSLSWIPQGIPGSIEDNTYAFDSEKAKQALAESSYGGPENLPEIKLTYNSDDPAAQPRIEWIAGQLRDILGINAVLDPTDGTTLSSLRKDATTYPQACLFCGNWFQDYPDPQNWLSVLWTCESTFAKRVAYCNPKLDELTTAADAELNQETRMELYEQASRILVEDLPAPFMYNLANLFVVKPHVTGYTKTAADANWPGQWGSLLTVDVNP